MGEIIFDIDVLTVRDRKIYDAMNDQEKKAYQKIWIEIQDNKLKLKQLSNASKSRLRREFYTASRKERRERAHRLIEHGALMEAYFDGLSKMNPAEVKEVVQTAASCDIVQAAIQGIQNRKEQEE